MISLKAKIRKRPEGYSGKKTEALKKSGRIPAVVYGPGIKNVLVDIDYHEFQKVFEETGESSLVDLKIQGGPGAPSGSYPEKRPVLIHEIQKDPVTDKFIHIDFFQVSLTEAVAVKIPLVFEGLSLAVKDLEGTLVKNISELEIKALPQNLPHEIRVSVDKLNTFEDHILVKDLALPEDVKVLAKADEIVVSVAPPAKVEEELAKPVEEKVEEVEKVEKEKKEVEAVENKIDEQGY